MLPKKNKKIKENNITGLTHQACFLFKQKKFILPELEAELLLAHVLKKDRVFILTHPENIIKPENVKEFKALVRARLTGWSNAVLLGYKEFYGLNFLVNKNVLVPRPETEILVDIILEQIESKKDATIIDIGTGSGAIITSLASNLKSHTKLNFYASDKSEKALIVARQNAKKHNTKITFLCGDLLKPYIPVIQKINPTNLIIAANLPYLNPKEMKELSIKKEPKTALLSGSDGLWHYKHLFSQLKSVKLPKVFLICEINHQQASNIKKLANASFPNSKIYFKNDYSHRVRFFILEL